MSSTPFRGRTALIVPLVLLVVSLLEDVAMYKLRQHVSDLYVRTALILVLTGAGFALAANYIGPWIKALFTRARMGSRWGAGRLGIWLFYAIAYGALFYAYLIVERHGPAALLPPSLR